MAGFKKGILSVGKYHANEGTLDVTPDRLKHWKQQFDAMKSDNLRVPTSFDHPADDADTLPVLFADAAGKRRTAANSVGFLDQFDLANDGQSAELTLDLRDAKAIEKAESNVVDISPIIRSEWKDGQGRVWEDIFTHVDLVTHPVDHKQTPFTPTDTIACSIRCSLEPGANQVVLKMADEPPAKDPREQDPAGKPPENPDMPDTGPSGDEQQMEAIIAHLEELGVSLPSDTDDSTFKDRLLTALKTVAAMNKKNEAEEAKNEKEDEPMPPKVEKPDTDTMMMSLEERRQIKLQSDAAYGFANDQYKLSLEKDLDELRNTGRCTPDEHESQRAALTTVRLSLEEDGKPTANAVSQFIANRKSIPEHSVVPLGRSPLRMAVAEPPSEMMAEETDEDADAAVDEVFGTKRQPEKQTA